MFAIKAAHHILINSQSILSQYNAFAVWKRRHCSAAPFVYKHLFPRWPKNKSPFSINAELENCENVCTLVVINKWNTKTVTLNLNFPSMVLLTVRIIWWGASMEAMKNVEAKTCIYRMYCILIRDTTAKSFHLLFHK